MAFVLVFLLVVYLGFAAWRGVDIARDGRPVAVALGLSVLVLPLIGAWLVWREVQFGFRVERLGRELAEQGGLPVDDLPRLPSGRIERDAADAAFAVRKTEVEAAPQDWRAWFRLGMAYDDARDRKRARAAMRRAVGLHAEAGLLTVGEIAAGNRDGERPGSGDIATDATGPP